MIIPKVTVVADDREAYTDVVRHLRARPDCAVEVRRLSLGDYEIGGRTVFERKCWQDLVASIVDGRLFRQACRLAGSRLSPALLLEGNEDALTDSGMTREAIQGALVTVGVILGIPMLHSNDAEESARIIVYAGQQMRRVVSGAITRPGYRPKSKRRIQLHILQGLPAVGPIRAGRLLDKFDTVEAVMTAAAQELTHVPGIGPAAAKKIRWAVSEPQAQSSYVDGMKPSRPLELF